MSAALVSFFFTAGAAGWLYTKFQKYSGNNAKSAAIATGVSAVVIFFNFFSIFKLIIK
jgi:hypothetical protein